MSRFVVTGADGVEQFEKPTGIAKARKVAKRLYKDENPDVAPYVRLYFSNRRDGTTLLVVDDGSECYATGITISREK